MMERIAFASFPATASQMTANHTSKTRPPVPKYRQFSRKRLARIYAGQGVPPNEERRKQKGVDEAIVLSVGIGLSVITILAIRFLGSGFIEDADSWSGIDAGGNIFSTGDIIAALIWSVALFYASPVQLLLFFLGKIETERPSDQILKLIGKFLGNDVDAVDYEPSLAMQLATIAVFIIAGVATAWGLEVLLGDSTWAVSTAIGSLVVSGVYEAGRPVRLSAAQLQLLELQWQDFAGWADARLTRNRGRCHETEIFNSFRKAFPKYRDEEVLTNENLRDMIRNWYPSVERTRTGYLKNVALTTSEITQ